MTGRRPFTPPDYHALITNAVASTRGMDGSFDSHRLTIRLMDAGVILGDEEHYGETCVLNALDACDVEPHECDVVDAICRELGIEAAA